MSLVVFDFDSTLTDTDTIKYLLINLFKLFPHRSINAFIKALIFSKNIQKSKAEIIGAFIKNKSESFIADNLIYFKQKVNIHLRKNIMQILEDHIAKNDNIIIATASPAFAISKVFDKKEINIVGTEFSKENGLFTGELKTPVCFGRQKLIMVQKFLENIGIKSIDVAYSDHYSDIPILSFAKKACLVFPDKITLEKTKFLNPYVIN
jgi:HAD superfamily phosphoserine phosphatase-like hydrolase